MPGEDSLWMMDDWLGIHPHHKFVPPYTQATRKPKEMRARGVLQLELHWTPGTSTSAALSWSPPGWL